MFKNNTPAKCTSTKRKRSESNKDFTKDNTPSSYGSLTEHAKKHLANIKKFKENIQHTGSYLGAGNNQNVKNKYEDCPTTSVIKTPSTSNNEIKETANKSKNSSKLKNIDYVQTKTHIKKENKGYVNEIKPIKTPSTSNNEIKKTANKSKNSSKLKNSDYVQTKTHIKKENKDYVNEIEPIIKIEILDESDNENVTNVKSEVLMSDDDQITIKQESVISNSDNQIQVKREIVDDVKIKHEILAIHEKDIKHEIEIISSEDELPETSTQSEASSYDLETDFYMYLDVIVISDSEEERAVVHKTTRENEPIQASNNYEVTTNSSKPFNSKNNVKQSDKVKCCENDKEYHSKKYTKHDKITRTTNSGTQKEIRARTVVVRNLPESVKETDLRLFFSRYGPVERTYLSRRHCKRPSAKYAILVCCFIRFQKRDDALKALEVNGMEYRKHHLKVDICKREKEYYPDRTIFVTNIPYNAEDDDLWNIFETCGLIKSITLVRNKNTKKVKGIGYIIFESTDSVELALKMKNVKLGKRRLKIKSFDISKLSKR